MTPACHNHLTDAEKADLKSAVDREDRERAERRSAATPACWSWPIPEESEPSTADRPLFLSAADELMLAFHERRCAICGRSEILVIDHDHVDGMVRGLLCHSCNTLEGRSDLPVVVKYRRVPPSVILNVSVEYAPMINGEKAIADPVVIEMLLRRPGYERHLLSHAQYLFSPLGNLLTTAQRDVEVAERLRGLPDYMRGLLGADDDQEVRPCWAGG